MATLRFRTNVNCGGCITTITPYLNQITGIIRWNVDTSNPLRILTAEVDGIEAQDIISALKKAGYRAEWIAAD